MTVNTSNARFGAADKRVACGRDFGVSRPSRVDVVAAARRSERADIRLAETGSSPRLDGRSRACWSTLQAHQSADGMRAARWSDFVREHSAECEQLDEQIA